MLTYTMNRSLYRQSNIQLLHVSAAKPIAALLGALAIMLNQLRDTNVSQFDAYEKRLYQTGVNALTRHRFVLFVFTNTLARRIGA